MLLRVDSSGASESAPIFDWTSGYPDFITLGGVNLITNADTGVLLTWTSSEALGTAPDPSTFQVHMTITTGASAGAVVTPDLPGNPQALVPVLQAWDGSFVGTITDIYTGDPSMIAFDQSGSLRWSVSGNYQPRISTPDGGVVAQPVNDDGSIGPSATIYDQNGSVTGQIPILPTQSWTGNEYSSSSGSLASMSIPPVFPAGDSYWSQLGGNPSQNNSAYLPCPCLLQSADSAEMAPAGLIATPVAKHRTGVRPADSYPPLKSYVILEGDPGLNLGSGHNHNVGALFHVAAETEQVTLSSLGNLAGSPQRVSSVQDFAAQLTGNGTITGGVVYFGHGAQQKYSDGTRSSVVAPGEQAGASTNISADNVNLLSGLQMDPSATVTLHACHVGFGAGRYSIAQLIANQLQRRVLAPVAGTFFSVDPDSKQNGVTAPKLPNNVSPPIYLLQDNGVRFTPFWPH